MLASNGRCTKTHYNYHMSVAELGILLRHLQDRYDPKWFVAVLIQFCLGMRASEMLSIQVQDFTDHFRYLNYRQAKTNKLIMREPVPEPLSKIIIAYIYYNQYRMKDGYLFSNYTGKGRKITTETYGAFWSKWRKGIAKTYPKFNEVYLVNGQPRHRISSHSLRRLHRTVLRNNVKDLYLVKTLCNYSDYSSLERYINEEELLEKKEEILNPIFTPMVTAMVLESKGQRTIAEFAR